MVGRPDRGAGNCPRNAAHLLLYPVEGGSLLGRSQPPCLLRDRGRFPHGRVPPALRISVGSSYRNLTVGASGGHRGHEVHLLVVAGNPGHTHAGCAVPMESGELDQPNSYFDRFRIVHELVHAFPAAGRPSRAISSNLVGPIASSYRLYPSRDRPVNGWSEAPSATECTMSCTYVQLDRP
jgi:hypothetical protein